MKGNNELLEMNTDEEENGDIIKNSELKKE